MTTITINKPQRRTRAFWPRLRAAIARAIANLDHQCDAYQDVLYPRCRADRSPAQGR